MATGDKIKTYIYFSSCGGKDALLNKEGVIANENVRQV